MRCGELLTPETKVCPKCGSRNRCITLEEHAKLLEMMIAKQKSPSFKEFKRRVKKGEKISRTGKLAREELIIDKEKRWKYHIVEEQNESGNWKIVHIHEGPL